jgi:hypothetical protein
VVVVVDRLPQPWIAGIIGWTTRAVAAVFIRPTWIATLELASMLNSQPGGRSEPPLEATSR